MKLYKLTNQGGCTQNDTQWGPGIKHTARRLNPGEKRSLCTSTVLHAYTDPCLAVLFNPIHASIPNPRLWEAKGKPVCDDGLKVGCVSLTTVKEIPLPTLTTNTLVRFAIYCSLRVYRDPSFVAWAKRWFSGKDRSAHAANAAADAAAEPINFARLIHLAIKHENEFEARQGDKS